MQSATTSSSNVAELRPSKEAWQNNQFRLDLITDIDEAVRSGLTGFSVKTGDYGQQVFVSSLGDLFNLKGVAAGDDAIQFIGSVTEATVQHYFKTRGR